MSWKLAGSYFETCSCDVVCPCTASLALGATHDRCNVTLVFRVHQGERGRDRRQRPDGRRYRGHAEGDERG